MLELKLTNIKNEIKAYAAGDTSVTLVYENEYQSGDAIILNCHQPDAFVNIWFEDSMQAALVYAPEGVLHFPIPPSDNRLNHSPKSFSGKLHLIRANLATQEELDGLRCLSFNPYDGHQATGYFPHATANVETRGEAVFFARNAIDGIFANDSHGGYPYQSWGINRDPDAALKISFGRTVSIHEVHITIRCDFPHDSWWTNAKLLFNDETERSIPLEKKAEPQRFVFSPIKSSSITLSKLIKADDSSPFPALTQIQVFGKEI